MTRLFMCIIGLALMGCTSGMGPGEMDFGADYRVEEASAPARSADSVGVTVSYGACATNREFNLQYRIRSVGSADLWLVKVTPNEPCEMLVTERRSFVLPDTLQAFQALTLFAPGGQSFDL